MSGQTGGGLGHGGGERVRPKGRPFGLVRQALVPTIAALFFLALSPAAAVSDPPSNAFRFVYDADGRLKAAIDPEGDTAAYDWDAVGNMLSIGRHDSDQLSILQLAPSRGDVGETVEINGTGFSATPGSNTVKFNSTAATVKAATPWSLTVDVPVGASSGPVTVQTPGEGPETSAQSFTVASSSGPSISSLSPTLAAAGEEVTISGANFEPLLVDNVVALDSMRPELVSASSAAIKFKVPSARLGGRVTVSTQNGSSTGIDLFVPPAGTATSKIGTMARLASGVQKTVEFTGSEKAALVLFDGTAGERASLVLSESTVTSGTVSIWSPNGTQLATGSFSKSGGGLIETGSLPTTGSYTALLSPAGASSGSVKVTPYDFPEPTGAIVPSATAEGVTKSVSIIAPGQNARFKVPLTTSTRVALRTNNSNMSGSYKVKWVSPDGFSSVIVSFGAKENWFWDTRTFSPAGDWTLMVDPEGIATGTVDLQVWEVPDKTGGAFAEGGGSVTSTIAIPGQRELITFAGVKDQLITWLTSESTIAAGVGVTLLRPNGAALAGGYPEQTTLPETGTYTFVVDPNPTGQQPVTNGTGSVKLTAKQVPPDQTGTITPVATSTGTTQAVSITAADQNARFKVPLSAGAKVALRTNNSNMSGSYIIKWISPDGLSSVSTTFGAKENWFWDTRTFTAGGEWTLLVDPQGNATGTVDLQLWEAPDKTGATITPSVGGGSLTSTITIPGQRELITFSGTASQLITVRAEESTIASGKMLVLKPDGTTLAGSEATFSTSIAGKREVTLPTTGTYTIVIDPPSTGSQPVTNGTGSVKVKAYIGSHAAWFAPSGPTTQLVRLTTEELTPPGFSDITAGGRVQRQVEAPSPAATDWGDGRAASRARADDITAAMRAFHPAPIKVWYPSRKKPAWEAPEPNSPWTEISDLRAPDGITALTGQVLERNGLPVAGVRVSVEGTSAGARTDEAGRFLLSDLPAGAQTLVVDGEGVADGRRYGSYEVKVELENGETTALDYTIWLAPLDPAGDRRVASPTRSETSLATPSIPGLEIRIPAGTVIRDAEGKVVRDLNITAIPVNQAPFPLPPFVPIPVYFTAQPGRAYLSKGAQIIYPNWAHLRPGQRAEFWNYDAKDRGWYVYGRGTVSSDGKQVIPDPGVRVWQFTGAMLAASPLPPGTYPTGTSTAGDPVDLYSGLFTYGKRDLVLPDTIPIDIQRTYRPGDSNSYSFGIGTTNQYDLRLWSGAEAAEANLILPDGQPLHYVRTTPGTGYTDAIYESTSTPGPFYGSKLEYSPGPNAAWWNLRLTNGMTFVFGIARLLEIRDGFGNALVITRSGENMTRITSPHGRWVKFSYDGFNRITELSDNGGRHVKYTYSSGRLTKVEGPAGRTTEYEYDGSGRMTAVVNARGNKYLQVAYDANGRVKTQTTADGGVFTFDYVLDETGKVEATKVTDPLGNQRKVGFDSEGFPVSNTRAVGTELAQTTSYDRQPGTGLVLSSTDPLGRTTEFDYDAVGNLTEMTRLAGTEDAVTTTFDYAPGTDRMTKLIDPLGHETDLEYGPKGELLKETDALGHETRIGYNGEGLPISITDPESGETTYSYTSGDLTSVTDALDRTTQRFVDSLGRVRSITSPQGRRLRMNYNEAGELTAFITPSGATTSIGRDADGDVTSVTDLRGGETTMAYDDMDRLETETDPLEATAERSYDKAGNLVKAISRSGKVSEFSYDTLGRLAKARFGVEGVGAESTIEYEYDDANRLIGANDSASGELVLGYDELDRITEVSGPQGTVGYEYDDAGRRTALTLPSQEPLAYEYDDANRLTALSRGAEVVSVAYDDAGRATGLTLPDGIEQLYGYDKAGQVTSMAYAHGNSSLGTIDYAYDLDGRLEAMWGDYARMTVPQAMGLGTYNSANELVERGAEKLSYDADGNLIDDGTNRYAWNARGELIGIDGPTDAAFAYDPFGRRISKAIGESTTGFLYDGGNIVQEYSGGELTGSILTGLALDEIFARTTGEDTESFLTDRLGSAIALADASGAVTTTYSYEPFGAVSSSGDASDNPYQFTGRENDGLGLQFNRARYYDPEAARFISPDPLGFAAGSANLYHYVNGAPLNFVDPTGEMEFSISIPSPQDLAESAVGAAADVGEFAWEHKEEIATGTAAGVCIWATATACGWAAGGAFLAGTTQNIEDHAGDCGGFLSSPGFWLDQAGTTAANAVGSLPGLLPKAVGEMSPSLLPPTRAGRWLYNTPPSATNLGASTVIEPGLQESFGGGSPATSSC